MTYWKLILSYDGTPFHGWQIQPTCPTVQGTLSDALFFLFGERVLPQGSGRTDAGVHALGQVASFGLHVDVPAANLQRALNRSLPPSIRVLRAEPVPETFHARHSAIRKTYEYRIYPRVASGGAAEDICSPFLAPYVWDCRWQLDAAAMHTAAAAILGTHDFTSFAATDPDQAARGDSLAAGPNPVKTIYDSAMEREGALLVYRVTGSGFLHHMVRNLVGTFVEVGRGALMGAEIQGILAARDRAAAGPTAPASGLFLVSVDYGDTD